MAEQVPFSLMQDIWEGIVKKRYTHGRESLSKPEQVWWDIRMLCDMTQSGGFLHYFHVTAGEDVQWLLNSLEVLGAIQTRDAVITLCCQFPGGWPSSDRQEREDQVDILHETVGEDELPWPEDLSMDDESDSEPLRLLLWRYWIEQSDLKRY